MIIAVALGAGLGVGLWALAVWLFPPRPALGVVLTRVHPAPAAAPAPVLTAGDTGWAARVGRAATAPLQALGLPGQRLARDLAALQRPVAAHLMWKATLAVAGLLAPMLLHLMLVLAGLPRGVEVPVIAGLGLAIAGFLAPDLRVRSDAERLRTGFRHALSAYLDLVCIALAGGAGLDSALNDSAATGDGWAFTRIRHALATARMTRTTPWAALRQLGEDLGVTELAELAASVSLAGTEGATVRTSLTAKAAALRTHQITDAEGQAQAATERMSLPVMALFLGFLAFITYPALTQVLTGI